MATLNPGIILQGAQPNILAAMDAGQQAGARQNAIQQQNALSQAYKTDGAGILSGNTESLNRLAAIDAPLAMNFRQSQQGMQIDAQNAQLRAAELARTLDADTRSRASEQFGMGANMIATAQTPEQFQTIISRPGFAESAGILGITPDMLTFENRDTLAAAALGAADVLKMRAGPEAKDDYQRYVQEEAAAGRVPLDRINFAQAIKGKGFEMTMPDGTKVSMGGSGQSESKDGPADPSSAIAMVNSIDGILNDPALETSTGVLAWTQAIPGTPMYRFGQRVKQLDGQAFLQAFESLKGGGQITEIEGTKATQAIGRLSSAQSAADYKEALTELRSILSTAAARPQGWVEQQRAIVEGTDVIPPDVMVTMSPEQIRALGPAGLTRIPLGQLKGLSDEQWDALEALGSGQ